MAEYGQAAAQGDGPKVLAKAAGALGSNSNSASNPWCVLGQVTFLRVSSKMEGDGGKPTFEVLMTSWNSSTQPVTGCENPPTHSAFPPAGWG